MSPAVYSVFTGVPDTVSLLRPFTVRVRVAVTVLSTALAAVIVQVPPFLAEITPFETVATAPFDEDHTRLCDASLGITVAERVKVSPSARVALCCERVMLSGGVEV